jgi:hypothetical protein
MSSIAKAGNKAEKSLCSDPRAKDALSKSFGKKIEEIVQITGSKKSDIGIRFEDGSIERIQNKDGDGGGRGWSFNRCKLDVLPLRDDGKLLAKNVCLSKLPERPSVPLNQAEKREIFETLFLGKDDEYKPTYFTHTQYKDGKLVQLSICSSEILINSLCSEAYDELLPKRTCVHVSPRIYLQRKGSKKDHSPDDIQCKLKSLPDIMTKLLDE